jgi:hypothetical protein
VLRELRKENANQINIPAARPTTLTNKAGTWHITPYPYHKRDATAETILVSYCC